MQQKCLFIIITTLLLLLVGCTTPATLSQFATHNQSCFDRDKHPYTFVVDSHNHFRAFGNKALDYQTLSGFFAPLGVLFVNVYGIGQTLPKNSVCQYPQSCLNEPVRPSITNDLINAANYIKYHKPSLPTSGVQLTLSMSFADLSQPQQVLAQITQLDQQYPGLFKWMGEVNLVKQALFENGHQPTSLRQIAQWQDFMALLRHRQMPIAIHADLGNDIAPTKYLHLMDEVLTQYPDNKIIWVHMGLSKEQLKMDPLKHIAIMTTRLNRHPNLILDISWKILHQHYFSHPQIRHHYVKFFNHFATRILPGSDFVAYAGKTFNDYQKSVQTNSKINQYLDNNAFRHIALGQNYFNLLHSSYRAPDICLK